MLPVSVRLLLKHCQQLQCSCQPRLTLMTSRNSSRSSSMAPGGMRQEQLPLLPLPLLLVVVLLLLLLLLQHLRLLLLLRPHPELQQQHLVLVLHQPALW